MTSEALKTRKLKLSEELFKYLSLENYDKSTLITIQLEPPKDPLSTKKTQAKSYIACRQITFPDAVSDQFGIDRDGEIVIQIITVEQEVDKSPPPLKIVEEEPQPSTSSSKPPSKLCTILTPPKNIPNYDQWFTLGNQLHVHCLTAIGKKHEMNYAMLVDNINTIIDKAYLWDIIDAVYRRHLKYESSEEMGNFNQILLQTNQVRRIATDVMKEMLSELSNRRHRCDFCRK